MTQDSPTQATPASEVFVSYASQDTAAANAIVEALERNGLRCWIAPRDVRAGAHYADAIVRAIGGAKFFVLVLSANAGASSHVGKEIERASSRKRPIIALRIDAAPLTPSLEYFLSESQWIEAQAGMMEAAYAKLIDAIREPDRTTLSDVPTVAPGASVRTAPAWHPISRRNRILFAAGLAVVAVTLAALWAAKFWTAEQVTAEQQPTTAAETAVSDKSIAVLPFVDMSAEKNQEYMADGIAEELLNLLAQVPDLKVIARTSSFAFKGQNIEIAEIAKKLNVAHVLEGSVRTAGNQLRITAQLVRAVDSTHLWSQKYDRPMADIFAVQDEIAKAVVSELKIKLLGAPPKANVTKPEVFALFLQARNIREQYTPTALEHAISLYRQALELDPEYVDAWTSLSGIYIDQAIEGLRPPDEGFRLGFETAQEALAVDPQDALAHARLGSVSIFYDRDLGNAARHVGRALALDPANTDIIVFAGILLRRLGRLQQAISVGEYIVAHDPVNADAFTHLGLAYRYAGHFDDALTQYQKTLALSPAGLNTRGLIGEVLMLQDNASAALAEIRTEPADEWDQYLESIALHALGQSTESNAAFDKFAEKYGRVYPSSVATAAAFRGENDRAFEWFERAAQLRDPSLGAIPWDQLCDSLHEDPRWLTFLRKHGMAPEQLAAIKFEVKLPQ